MRAARVCASVVLLASAVLATTPAQAYSCGSLFNYRGFDTASGVSNARSVQGKIKIPASGSITGVSSSHAQSAADVFLINGNDFVQAGWYVGSTGTGLSYVTTPHFWWGEYDPSKPGDEKLHTMGGLSWGSAHTVKISFDSTAGQYDFYLDGVYKDTTNRTHFTQGQASFNGEIDFACVRMEAIASNAPSKTLQYATYGTGGVSWHYFNDARGVVTKSPVTLVSTSAGTAASDYSYGGGS